MIYWTLFYLVLARLLKRLTNKIQLHSIIHCITATIWSSYLLWYYEPLFELYKRVIIHSIGYFIADIIDIMLDDNIKRRIYIIHHISSIIGLLPVYFGCYFSIYGIWTLEIGGIVHHLKYAAEVNNVNIILYWMAHILYHVVYLSSRFALLFIAITIIAPKTTDITGVITIFFGAVLLIQNFIWWYYNVKKYFK